MEIAVVGTPEFTLGFQLAGVTRLYHPEGDEALADTMRNLLTQKDVGIVVVDSANLTLLSDRLRSRIADSITPTVLGIGTEEDNTLRESIKSALGVDLWK
ncbi:MAG TPA: V-type ATP synthase subunit F [Candidatus Thalassarchaeaceae archaeon]|jgi:V/A-type H+-transporting ATPase subunit F|nr:V-type ATP synthase subunit F [Candidatus Thalassarchaeaceae archaeon]HJM67390.1 V-type ATP synthase subunit F [Candidatus Thalassarchaeaceae archaeon]